MIVQIARIAAVIALLCAASALATPPGRLPLVLRGVQRVLQKDRGEAPSDGGDRVSARRRIAAFLLVLAAVALAVGWPRMS